MGTADDSITAFHFIKQQQQFPTEYLIHIQFFHSWQRDNWFNMLLSKNMTIAMLLTNRPHTSSSIPHNIDVDMNWSDSDIKTVGKIELM